MIKYAICPNQFRRTGDSFLMTEAFVATVFKKLEEKNLESRLYNIQIGQRQFLYSYEYSCEESVFIFFVSAGANKGYFMQKYNYAGRIHNSRTMEFTF